MKPPRLCKGDTIALLAPSSPMDANGDVARRGEEYLSSLGFRVKRYPSFVSPAGSASYLAGSDEVRARDVMEAFTDPAIQGIICVRGGYGASRILDALDYEVIRTHPKLFSGYSDITVLLNAFYEKSSLPALHGPMLCSFGSKDWDRWSRMDFESWLFAPLAGRVLVPPFGTARTLVGGSAEGVIVGGNLSLVANLQGTPFAIDAKEKILFLEEVDEAPYSLDRYLTNLRLSGVLSACAGVVLGYFSRTKGDTDGRETKRIIEETFKGLDKPVLAGFASGHDYPFATLPIGLRARLDATAGTVTILEEYHETA